MFRLCLETQSHRENERERDSSGQIEIPSQGTDSTLFFATGTSLVNPDDKHKYREMW